MKEVTIAKNTLGQYKNHYMEIYGKNCLDKDNLEPRLESRMMEDASSYGLKLDEFRQLLSTVKGQSKKNISIAKDTFRVEFNRLLDNLLYSINNTTDTRVSDTLKALLDYDNQYQSLTKVGQSSRTDWRGLIVLAPYINDTSKLARYIGGWNDGSKKERDQYSSGRRVPVSKSTGYAKEQVLPVLTGKDTKKEKRIRKNKK